MSCNAIYYDEKDRAERRLKRRPIPWYCTGEHAADEPHSTGPLALRDPVTWADSDEGAKRDRRATR